MHYLTPAKVTLTVWEEGRTDRTDFTTPKGAGWEPPVPVCTSTVLQVLAGRCGSNPSDGGKPLCNGRLGSPVDQDEMRPQLLLQQHMGTCSRTPKPLPRECSNTSVQTTASWGNQNGGNPPGCHNSTDWCKKNLILGDEDKSCPAATGKPCYTRASRAPVCTRSPRP